MSDPLTLDMPSTALVLIDLQRGILASNVAPHAPADVLARGIRLAEAFRKLQSPVFLVRVSFSPDGADALTPPRDSTFGVAHAEGWDVLDEKLGPRPGDFVITKRQWGAFYGTELDLQLRRRNIRTIVLGGISTNIGVESTARDAFERNYALVFAEDAMAGPSTEAHNFAVKTIFPRLGRIRSTDEILAAIAR